VVLSFQRILAALSEEPRVVFDMDLGVDLVERRLNVANSATATCDGGPKPQADVGGQLRNARGATLSIQCGGIAYTLR
jgi:hypothetical protein